MSFRHILLIIASIGLGVIAVAVAVAIYFELREIEMESMQNKNMYPFPYVEPCPKRFQTLDLRGEPSIPIDTSNIWNNPNGMPYDPAFCHGRHLEIDD